VALHAVLAFFLRHAESVSNAEPDRDLPDEHGDRLTDRGHEQARLAARQLTDLGVTRLWSSPLQRAGETAAALAGPLALEVEVVDDLHELRESDGYGDRGGEDQRLRRWSEQMAEHPDDPTHSYRGGESFRDVYERVERLKTSLLEVSDERVLAVSHGILLRFFWIHSFMGNEFGPRHARRLWQLQTLNCGLSAFEHREPGDPLNPGPAEWLCLSWMARLWDPL
jgi:broad specificity phosphatase PhoE